MRRWMPMLWIGWTTLLLQAAWAQSDAEILKTLSSESSSIEQVDRVIAIDEKATDEGIAQRLKNILSSTEQFAELEVEVREGLVFLEGVASEERYVDLASDLAGNIEGVVAVVNRLSVEERTILSTQVMQQELTSLWRSTLKVLPLIAVGLLVFFAFFFLSRPLSRWLSRPISYVSQSELIRIVIQRVISIFLILMGLYFFLRIAGLTQIALAIISGTGVIGLVLGFAFRDIAENFISSLLLSMQRPFQLNDVIEVAGHKGVVRKVTSRGTTLVDYDGNHIQIPNATIYKNVIQNLSANPKLRGSFVIGIGYDASIRKAQELGVALMLDHAAVLNDPEPQVLVDKLGSSTINLMVYFWVDSHQHSVAKVGSILMRLILRKYEEYELTMPDDAREVIFPQGVPVIMSSDQSPAKGPADAEVSHKALIEEDQREDRSRSVDDVSSDTEDIQKQAEQSRDPEEGENII